MKRTVLFLFAIGIVAISSTAMGAMSNSKIRKETRFLTDKMAQELNMTTAQYNDVYEINFDFINSIGYLMDDAVRGNEWALNEYYGSLDIRNDDLRWVLNDMQYRRFIQTDYFYRPVYASGGRWNFRIYITYTNHNQFFFGKPYHYRSYAGGRYRRTNNVSFYRGRYNQKQYSGSHSVRDNKVYQSNRRSDFGSVTTRPGTTTRPSSTTNTGRKSDSSATKQRETTRPSSTPSSGNRSKSESTSTRRSEQTKPSSSPSTTRPGRSDSSSASSSSEKNSGSSRRQ